MGAVIEPGEIRGIEKVPNILGPPVEGHSASAATWGPESCVTNSPALFFSQLEAKGQESLLTQLKKVDIPGHRAVRKDGGWIPGACGKYLSHLSYRR